MTPHDKAIEAAARALVYRQDGATWKFMSDHARELAARDATECIRAFLLACEASEGMENARFVHLARTGDGVAALTVAIRKCAEELGNE